ncbi:MAG TPA: hypothetical protein VGD35_02025 [Chitinophaga sp.]
MKKVIAILAIIVLTVALVLQCTLGIIQDEAAVEAIPELIR